MTEDEFKKMIDKYLLGQASQSEIDLVDNFLNAQHLEKSSHADVTQEIWSSIQHKIKDKREAQKTFYTRSAFRKSVRISLVMILVLAVFSGIYFSGYFTTTGQWLTVSTKPGEKLIFTLPDGSVAYLNSASSISYPEKFLSSQREVMLSGEAFFEVSKDEQKPFSIRTGHVITKVLGTSFNISAFQHQKISVTVATGKVEVSTNEEIIDSNKNTPSTRTVIIRGQQAMYDPAFKKLSTKEVNIEPYLAWKNNTLQFDNTSLHEAADILQRWYNVTIEFENESLKHCQLNGQYKDQSFIHVLESIQFMYNIEYTLQSDRHVVLRGKGCASN
jgi:transmembrane sensor